MQLKPTKPKIILSIIAVLLWFAYVVYRDQETQLFCSEMACFFEWGFLSPIMACPCISFLALLQIYAVLLFPGVIVYIAESFREHRKSKQ